MTTAIDGSATSGPWTMTGPVPVYILDQPKLNWFRTTLHYDHSDRWSSHKWTMDHDRSRTSLYFGPTQIELVQDQSTLHYNHSDIDGPATSGT